MAKSPDQHRANGTPGSDRPVVAILGLGQMGLVCSTILADPERNGKEARLRPHVVIWGHDPEEASRTAQTRKNERMPGLRIPQEVTITGDAKAALAGASLIVSAIPVQYCRSVWEQVRPHVPKRASIVSVAKGIENGTLMRPTQIVAEALNDDPDRASRPIAALSGPTIASELARCLPATMIAAGDDEKFRKQVQELFSTRWVRIYTTGDMLGVELAGAMKNVIAIAAGICDGLQAGYNAKSALLARGLAEIARLGVAMGASTDTFFGIAGVGDLATSCFSPEGRNRSCGEALGKGAKPEDYLRRTRSVVEGVATTKSVMDLARKYRVDMPLTQAVHAVLFEGLDPLDAVGQLMNREPKPERVW